MSMSIKAAGLALATGGLALATPATAEPISQSYGWNTAPIYGAMTYEHSRKHRDYDRDDDDYREYRGRDYYGDYGRGYRSYGEPVYRNTRVWRGRDGRYYCRRSNGTTGFIIGAAGGALLGREVAGRYGDRTLGAILGGAAGALLGKSIDSGVRCR